MANRTVWGKWDCTQCGAVGVSGKHKQCTACANPREAHELAAMYIGAPRRADGGVEAPSITDPDELAMAHAGADWSCGFCGSNNKGTAGTCRSCAGDRVEATSVGAVFDVDAAAEGVTPEARRKWKIAAGVGVLVAAIAAFVWWGNQTSEIEGEVKGLSWEHTTVIQSWRDVSSGGWAPMVARSERRPVAGKGEVAGIRITGCRQKHHHDEQYQCGTQTESYTEQVQCGTTQSCSMVNNGNGSFTESCTNVPQYCSESRTRQVPKYCNRPIYREWCDFITQRWTDGQSQKATGVEHENMRWPELTPNGDLQRIQRRGQWTVHIGYRHRAKGHSHQHSVSSEAAYLKFHLGQSRTLTVKNFGDVVAVR